jgi:alkylhydroperoxidase family enzyme
MARIPLTPPRTVLLRVGEWYSRRVYNQVLDPALRSLAVLAVEARVGCSCCLDAARRAGHEKGVPTVKLRNVPFWRDRTDLYTDLELLVMEYAEAMTETVPAVTEEMAQCLLADLGEAAFVELTAVIGVQNLRSRTDTVFGLLGRSLHRSNRKGHCRDHRRDRCRIPIGRVVSQA